MPDMQMWWCVENIQEKWDVIWWAIGVIDERSKTNK